MAAGPSRRCGHGASGMFLSPCAASPSFKRTRPPSGRAVVGGREGSLADSLLTRLLPLVALGFVGEGDVLVQPNEQAGWIGAASAFPSF